MSEVSLLWRASFIGALTTLTGIRLYYKVRAGSLFMRPASYRSDGVLAIAGRLVLGLPMAVASAETSFAPGSIPWIYLPAPAWLRAVGVVTAVGGLGLLGSAHRALDGAFSTAIGIKPGQRLVTSGPYARIRNPIYVAYVGLFGGLGLCSGNWLFMACGVGMISILMTTRLRREERLLEDAFGDEYRAWAARTGKFLPRIKARHFASSAS